MPHVNDMIVSKFVSKADVERGPIAVTIRGVSLDSGGRAGEDPKWLMHFNELRKTLKLNTVTLRALAAAFGPQSDAWVGKKVRLYLDPTVMMAGQVVGGVRMQMPRGSGVPGMAAPAGAPKPVSYDPATGRPIYATPGFHPTEPPPAAQAPAAGPTFDSRGHAVDTSTGEIARPAADPDFDDDIPF